MTVVSGTPGHSIEDESCGISRSPSQTDTHADSWCRITASYPVTDSIKNVEAEQQWMPRLINVFFYKMSSDLRLSVLLLVMLHVQAAKPRSAILPILYMVGVSLDHNHASRLAVEMMSKLGYSVSYDEVYVLSSALHSVATMKTQCKVSQSFSHSGLLIMPKPRMA